MENYQEKINYKNFSIAWTYDEYPENPFECDGSLILCDNFGGNNNIEDLISTADFDSLSIDEWLKKNAVNHRYVGWRYGGNVQGDREFYVCGKNLQYHDGLSVIYTTDDKSGYSNDENFERICKNIMKEYQAYYNHDFIIVDIDDNLGNSVEHGIDGFTNSDDAIQYCKDYIDKYMVSINNRRSLAVNGSLEDVKVELSNLLSNHLADVLNSINEKTLRQVLYEINDSIK